MLLAACNPNVYFIFYGQSRLQVGFHEPFYDPRKGSQPDDDATLIELAASIKAAEMCS